VSTTRSLIFSQKSEGQDEDLNNLWETLKEREETEGVGDYLAVDQELVTYGALTIGEIVEICSTKEAEDSRHTDVFEEELLLPSQPEKPARHYRFSRYLCGPKWKSKRTNCM
jgi:hypothetical protein